MSTGTTGTPGESSRRPCFYLSVEDVLGFYAGLFGCSEEQATDQLRNPGQLEAALNRPRTYAHYHDADVALQAAVLAHGIAESQPFIEGNKRTALVSLATFLLLNGYDLLAEQDQRMLWMIRLSEGWTIEEFAEELRAAMIPAR